MKTPDEDLAFLRDSFTSAYTKKYKSGVAEHGGGLWTAGGGWYLNEAKKEALDLWSYLQHASRCMETALQVAFKLRNGMITNEQAAKELVKAVGNHPPNTFREETQTEKTNIQ